MRDFRKMYSEYVLGRLEQYGFEKGMYSQKYTRYVAVNNIVRLRLQAAGIKIPKSTNSLITREYYIAAVNMVNQVLPAPGLLEERYG